MELSNRHAGYFGLLFRNVGEFVVLVFLVFALCVCSHVDKTWANGYVSVAVYVVSYRVAVVRPGCLLGVGCALRVFLGLRFVRLPIAVKQRWAFKDHRRYARAVAFGEASFRGGARAISVTSFRGSIFGNAANGLVVRVKDGLRPPTVGDRVRRKENVCIRRNGDSVVAYPNVVYAALRGTCVLRVRDDGSLLLRFFQFKHCGRWRLSLDSLVNCVSGAFLRFVGRVNPIYPHVEPNRLGAALQVPFDEGGKYPRLYLLDRRLAGVRLRVLFQATQAEGPGCGSRLFAYGLVFVGL